MGDGGGVGLMSEESRNKGWNFASDESVGD